MHQVIGPNILSVFFVLLYDNCLYTLIQFYTVVENFLATIYGKKKIKFLRQKKTSCKVFYIIAEQKVKDICSAIFDYFHHGAPISSSSQSKKETLQQSGLREEEQVVEDKSYSSIQTNVSEHASVVSEGSDSSYGDNNSVKFSDVPTSLGSKSNVKKQVGHSNSLAATKNQGKPKQGGLREEAQSIEERLYSPIKADVSYCASAVSKGSMKCRKLPPVLCHKSSLEKAAAHYDGASDCKNKTSTQKAVMEKEVHSVEEKLSSLMETDMSHDSAASGYKDEGTPCKSGLKDEILTGVSECTSAISNSDNISIKCEVSEENNKELKILPL